MATSDCSNVKASEEQMNVPSLNSVESEPKGINGPEIATCTVKASKDKKKLQIITYSLKKALLWHIPVHTNAPAHINTSSDILTFSGES